MSRLVIRGVTISTNSSKLTVGLSNLSMSVIICRTSCFLICREEYLSRLSWCFIIDLILIVFCLSRDYREAKRPESSFDLLDVDGSLLFRVKKLEGFRYFFRFLHKEGQAVQHFKPEKYRGQCRDTPLQSSRLFSSRFSLLQHQQRVSLLCRSDCRDLSVAPRPFLKLMRFEIEIWTQSERNSEISDFTRCGIAVVRPLLSWSRG